MKKIRVAIVLLAISLAGCANSAKNVVRKIDDVMNNNPETVSTSQKAGEDGNQETVYAVDDLISSDLSEGQSVKMVGTVGNCMEIKPEPDYEGPGSGCVIKGMAGEITIDDMSIGKRKGENVVVSGKVKYCGGKKKIKTLCALSDAKIEQ